MKTPRLLDLYCKAGGASMGYSRAGFEVVGVDIEPQPRYPFPFILGDAIDILTRMLAGERFLASDGNWYGLDDFDAIHASPVCKGYSTLASLYPERDYPDQVGETREALAATGKPYSIENVEGAPLVNYVTLCGTMFGLRVIRHRNFECNPPVFFSPMSCNHWGKTQPRNDKRGTNKTPHLADGGFLTITGNDYLADEGRAAMGISWMIKEELSQAVPPAYTEFIGRQLLAVLQ